MAKGGFGGMKSKLGKGRGAPAISSGMKGSLPGTGKRATMTTPFKQAAQITGKR